MEGNYYCLGPVGALIVLIGLYFGWRALKDWMRYRSSGNWIPITAQVTKSFVDTTVDSDSGNTTYTPIITYTYLLVGKSYQGDLISFGSKGQGMKSKKAEALVVCYPVDSQPVIYYNPDDPSQSVLERKYNRAGALTCLGFLLFGAAMLYGSSLGY
jgi:hypothetical protein